MSLGGAYVLILYFEMADEAEGEAVGKGIANSMSLTVGAFQKCVEDTNASPMRNLEHTAYTEASGTAPLGDTTVLSALRAAK